MAGAWRRILMNARTILELLQSLNDAYCLYAVYSPSQPFFQSLGKKHTSSQTPKTLPPNTSLKTKKC